MEPEEIGIPAEDLIAAAGNVESFETDTQKLTERSLPDLIEMDKYLRGKNAVAKTPADPFAGLRFGIIIPPGTRGRQ